MAGKKAKKKGGNPGRRGAQRIADMPERLMMVDSLLRQCWGHGAITKACAENWGVTPRQVRNYIKKVYEQWDEDAKKTLVDRVALRRAQLEGVLEACMNGPSPDLKTAVQALDRLCRIDGAYAPTEVQHGGKVEHTLADRTSGDKRTELEQLLEKYGAPKPAAPSKAVN